MNLLWFILIGAGAGWLASQLLKGSGLGFWGNLVTGICGGLLGGLLADELKLDIKAGSDLVNKLVIATGGSIILLLFINMMKKKS
jgi:uncharacterized membrane protein YeaQ/YmgE (transglycosylase-associated protein family)